MPNYQTSLTPLHPSLIKAHHNRNAEKLGLGSDSIDIQTVFTLL